MLHSNYFKCHKDRPLCTLLPANSSSKLARPTRRRSTQKNNSSSRLLRLSCHCIHKEYARQGSAAQQQQQQHEDEPGSKQQPDATRAPPSASSSSRQLLSVPEDIVLECLTIMRRGELSGLQPYLPTDRLAPQGAPVLLAGVPVHEQGPLARCAPFMDTAARRVLPGHLLRRARVLSSLQVGGSCLLRVALTACTGEETVLVWRLALTTLPGMQHMQQPQQQDQDAVDAPTKQQHMQQQDQDAVDAPTMQQQQQQQPQQQDQEMQAQQPAQHSGPQQQQAAPPPLQPQPQQQQQARPQQQQPSSSSPQACWQVVSITQEAFSEDQHELPSSPHPRVAPELVVRAQLEALRQQQLLRACGFNLMCRHASSSGWEAHLTAFKQLLQQPHYSLLSTHVESQLGASALPTQRQFLQEVVLKGDATEQQGDVGKDEDGGSSSDVGEQRHAGRFLWRLGMQADGCWMVRSIEVL